MRRLSSGHESLANMTTKRNILLIIADDLGKYVGCYGCPSVTTPNLDKLSAEGVRFDMGFASTASCSGSRSTIYTGLHTHENGQYGLMQQRTHFQTFDHIDSLPLLFNHAGYLTGSVYKSDMALTQVQHCRKSSRWRSSSISVDSMG